MTWGFLFLIKRYKKSFESFFYKINILYFRGDNYWGEYVFESRRDEKWSWIKFLEMIGREKEILLEVKRDLILVFENDGMMLKCRDLGMEFA